MEILKTCSKCSEKLPITNFYRNSQSYDNHRPDCKKCLNSLQQLYYNKNSDTIKERVKKYRNKNSRKIKDYRKKYYLANKEKLKEQAKDRYFNRGGKDNSRNAKLQKAYNISLDEYNTIFAEQGNCCAICRRQKCKTGKSMAVDHCHVTGKIRGILCANCNRSLGVLGESIEILTNMISYLYKHKDSK